MNIKEIYRRGGNLNDVLACPLLTRIRQWQNEYAYTQPAENTGNWLCPCALRDHFGEFLDAARDCRARPIDEEAAEALADPEYHCGMVAYGEDYGRLSGEIWNERYVHQQMAHAI